jgi:hypothetical protein
VPPNIPARDYRGERVPVFSLRDRWLLEDGDLYGLPNEHHLLDADELPTVSPLSVEAILQVKVVAAELV